MKGIWRGTQFLFPVSSVHVEAPCSQAFCWPEKALGSKLRNRQFLSWTWISWTALGSQRTCLVMQSEQIRVVPLKEDFLSLQAKENITAGSFLTDLWGPEFDKATSHTVQVTENKHVEPQGGMKFTNHSCLPNARFIFSNYHPSHSSNLQDGHSIWWHMVACRDIKEGEDITFDYNTTEYEMDAPFSCGCGTQKCLGDVRGFRFLSDEEKKDRLAYLSPVIKELHSMQA